MDIIKTTTYDKGEEGWKSLVAAVFSTIPNPTGFEPTLEGGQYPGQTLKMTARRWKAEPTPHTRVTECRIAANVYAGAAIHVFSDVSVGIVIEVTDPTMNKTKAVMFRGRGLTIADDVENAIEEGLKHPLEDCPSYPPAGTDAGPEHTAPVHIGNTGICIVASSCGPDNSKHTGYEEDYNG